VLLCDDVVADRQAEAGALAGWLGGEERLEKFVPDVCRDTGAVVPDADFDRIAGIAGSDLQRREESGVLAELKATRMLERVSQASAQWSSGDAARPA
jgi:hypothetical protein